MMKILALTDFSPLSKVGITYAAKLCVAFDAKLIVMNVVHIDQLTRTRSDFTTDDVVVKRRIREQEELCKKLIEEVRTDVKDDLKAEYSVENEGPFAETVNTFALRHQCDLIVMGTKGASGLKKTIFGSNAASVISQSPLPVLTIPEFAVCRGGINDIVYASDLNRIFDEIALLLSLAKKFASKIHVLHVYQSESMPKIDEITMAENLQKELNYSKIDCTYIANADVKNGIDQYLNGKNADVVAMFSGKRNFLERIFDRSNSREMIFKSPVPLLTFNK